MNVVIPILLCFIPLVAFFVCLKLLMPCFKIFKGLIACLLGLFSVIPIAAFQFLLDAQHLFTASSLLTVLVQSLVLNGLIEEAIKMGLLFIVPAKDMELKEFFAYSLLCGLAVGCFESVIYLISGYENVGLRMITAVIIHVTCTGLSGLFVYSVKYKCRKVLPFVLAVLIHGIYNYFAGFSGGIQYFSFIVILFAVIECRVRYKSILEPDETDLPVM